MSRYRWVINRLGALVGRAARERELEEELRFHLETEADEQETAGLSRGDATIAARRDLGSVAIVKERTREVWGWCSLERLIQDLRGGARLIRRGPAFASAAILSLALGIGANTAVFSVVDLVLLRSLPVPAAEQLVILAHRGTGDSGTPPASGEPGTGANYPLYELIRAGSRSFSGVVAFWSIGFKVRVGTKVESSQGQYVTADYFSVLGVQPLLGRGVEAVDLTSPVAVISYGFWQRAYGAGPDVLGKELIVNGVPLTIIGVTPPEFFGLQRGLSVDVSVPFGMQAHVSPDYGNRLAMRNGTWSLTIVGRLEPDASVESARAESEALVRPWVEDVILRETGGRPGSWARVELLPGSAGLHALRRRFSKPLTILMAIVIAVLLISCACRALRIAPAEALRKG